MITSVPDAATPSRSFHGEDAADSSLTATPRRAMVHHEGSPLSVPVSGTSSDYGSINSTGYTLVSLPSCSEDRSHFAPLLAPPIESATIQAGEGCTRCEVGVRHIRSRDSRSSMM